MNLLSWIVFGLIVGVVANILDPRPARGGMLAAMALGVGGALVGGFMATLLFGVGITGFDINSFVIAVVGSLAVLYVSRAFSQA